MKAIFCCIIAIAFVCSGCYSLNARAGNASISERDATAGVIGGAVFGTALILGTAYMLSEKENKKPVVTDVDGFGKVVTTDPDANATFIDLRESPSGTRAPVPQQQLPRRYPDSPEHPEYQDTAIKNQGPQILQASMIPDESNQGIHEKIIWDYDKYGNPIYAYRMRP